MTSPRRQFRRAIEGVEALAVKPAGPDAWFLDWPFLPWRQKRADLERRDLFRLLLAHEPVCGFCLDSDQRRDLLADIGIKRVTSPDWPPWLFMQADDAVQSLDHLYVGDWCLFLFDRLPPEPPPAPQHLVTEAATIRQFIQDIGASVCVLSFPDDREWLVVFAGRGDLATPA